MSTDTECRSCGRTLPVEAFRPQRRVCRECEADRSRARRRPAAGVTKQCSNCGRVKPLTAYTPNRTSADGRHNRCKDCRAEATRERRRSPQPEPPATPQPEPPAHRVQAAPFVVAETARLRALSPGIAGSDDAWLKLSHHIAAHSDRLGPQRTTPRMQRLAAAASRWQTEWGARWQPDLGDADQAAQDGALLQRLADEAIDTIADYLAALAAHSPDWRTAIDAAPEPPPLAIDTTPDDTDTADRTPVAIPPSFLAAAASTIKACAVLHPDTARDPLAVARLVQAAETIDHHRSETTVDQLRAFGEAVNRYLDRFAPPAVARRGGRELIEQIRRTADDLWPHALRRAAQLPTSPAPSPADAAAASADNYRATLITAPPLNATLPTPAASGNRLPHIAMLAAWQGRRPMHWQCLVLHTATQTQHDGRWWHTDVTITTPRQVGKTELLLWIGLDFVVMQAERRQVAQSSNNITDAWHKLVNEQWPALDGAGLPAAAGLHLRRSTANPAVERAAVDGGNYRIISADSDAGHGGTNDAAIIDEGHTYRDDSKLVALDYTLRTTAGILVLCGTKGPNDGSADWWHGYLDAARTALLETDPGPDTRAFFEWAPPPETDPHNRDTWPPALPSLGHTLSWDRLIAEYERASDIASFARGTLNLYLDAADQQAIDPAELAAVTAPAAEIDPLRPWVLAVDIAPNDRAHTHVAATDGRTIQMAYNAEGHDWLPDYLAQARRANPHIAAVAAFSPRGPLSERLQGLERSSSLTIEAYNTARAGLAVQHFLADIAHQRVAIRPNQRFTDAVRQAQRHTTETSQTVIWRRSNRRSGDISALWSYTFAWHAWHAVTSRPTAFSSADRREIQRLHTELFGEPLPPPSRRRNSPDKNRWETQEAAAEALFVVRHGRQPHTPRSA